MNILIFLLLFNSCEKTVEIKVWDNNNHLIAWVELDQDEQVEIETKSEWVWLEIYDEGEKRTFVKNNSSSIIFYKNGISVKMKNSRTINLNCKPQA